MSYILDALKKIEHEKNKKRSGGRISVSNNLFEERVQPTGKAGVWKLVVLIAGVSLLACAGTWFFLGGNRIKNTPPVQLSAPLPVVPVPPPAPPAAPSVPVVMPSSAPPNINAVAAPQKNRETEESGRFPSHAVQEAAKQVKARPVAQRLPVQLIQAPADIKLSGIAWQEDRSSRRAVINGFLLKEGAIVSGAKIVDIKADRVGFSSVAGPFEIRLDAVLPAAEVKK